MNDTPIRRRVLLGAAGVAVLSARFALPASAEPGPKVEAMSELVSLPISPGRSASIPRVLGIAVSDIDVLPKGTSIDFDFDPNLYDLMPTAVIQSGSLIDRLPIPGNRTASPKRHTLSVTLMRAIPVAQGCAIWIGALKPRWFPYDSVRLMPRGSHVISGGKANGKRLEIGRRRDERIWGVRLGCQWRTFDLGRPYRTYAPEMITLTSVGPSPTPPNLNVFGFNWTRL